MGASTVCVDASFVARLFLGPDDAGYWKVLEGWRAEGKTMSAPALVAYELTNVFYRCHRAGYLSLASARLALDAALGLPIRLEDDTDLHREAVAIAASAGSAATYDAHYLALARRLNAELWTADARLAHRAGPGGPTVRLVPKVLAPSAAMPGSAPEPAVPTPPA